MLFKAFLLSTFLLACAVLVQAVPAPPYNVRVARRRGGRQSQPNYLEQPTGVAGVMNGKYSVNWAGAVWDEGRGTFTSVTGTFTVPIPSGQNGSAASAWVGIDGDTCTQAILQTGIDFTLSNGRISYDAWYEWYPDSAHNFSGIKISPGDVIRLTVNASSMTSGAAIIENLTNGEKVSQNLNSTFALCQQNAEWIVEDFAQGGNLVPFSNFSSVTFTNAKATGNGTYTPSGANIVNIQQNSQVLTSVSTNGPSVTIMYV